MTAGAFAIFRRGGAGGASAERRARADAQRLQIATITTEIASRITRRMALDDVLTTAVNLIRDSYPDVYHVQVFLLDPLGEQARLAASTGEVGRDLLQRGHALEVGGVSVIGRVTGVGEAVIARAGDGVHRPNPLLPDTQLEAAFPMRLGDSVIGALDMQSARRDAITEEDVPVLQALADTLAVGVDNARLAEQTEQRLAENQRLLEDARRNAAEVERLNQQLSHQSWSEFLADRHRDKTPLAYTLDGATGETSPGASWSSALTEAVEFGRLVQAQTRASQVVAVPLRVRGDVIGALELELEAGALDAEDVALVATVAERLSIALDNNRLYNESRRAARREATLNEIGGRMQASNHVDAVLAAAARSLQDTLGAQRVAIRIGSLAAAEAANAHNVGAANGDGQGDAR